MLNIKLTLVGYLAFFGRDEEQALSMAFEILLV